MVEDRGRRRTAIVLATLGGILVLVVVAAVLASGASWGAVVDSYTVTNCVLGVAFLASGVPPTWATRNPVGPLLLCAGLAHLLSAAATAMALLGLAADWPDTWLQVLSTVVIGPWQLGVGLLFPLALLLFPDGALPGPRWRWLAVVVIGCGLAQAVTGVLSQGTPYSVDATHDSALSVGLELPGYVVTALGIMTTGSFIAVVGSLVLRYRRGDARTRRQLLWPVAALLLILALNVQRVVTGDGPVLLLLAGALVPVAIAVAIVRDELFDIELVISRALLWGLSVAGVVAAYVVLVSLLARLFPTAESRWGPVVAALAVALLFAPLHRLVRRAVDRAFYGMRADPAAAAWTVGRGFGRDHGVPVVLEQACSTLRLPGLLLLDPAGRTLAAAGAVGGGPTAEIVLDHREGALGRLVVALRPGERRLHEADRRTLELIAMPLAVALVALALEEQVRQARAATVEAAEAERRHLSRELHDGVGPVLTSVAFRADAAANVMRTEPERAAELLAEIGAEVRGALDDVRRIVHDLTPVELGQGGLSEALRQRVAGWPPGAGTTVELELPEQLPVLTPAVERAAYRILTEALTNVLRHSDGRRCRVAVTANGVLGLSVDDDGRPPSSWTPGVGLRSLRDRAEELGGGASAGPFEGGWLVSAWLPLDPGPS
ncbi:sensor histidine kinase [Nocardioides euryhalodurans]|nr:sensor histidine kinase [Nocardioides euryhalodurans]